MIVSGYKLLVKDGEYSLFGVKQAIKFFSELDEGAQRCLANRIKIDKDHKPADVVVHKLYIVRSEFVHQARLILEFNDGLMFSRREGNVMDSKFSFW